MSQFKQLATAADAAGGQQHDPSGFGDPVLARGTDDVVESQSLLVPQGFSWAAARRLTIFFGDAMDGVRSEYENLAAAQRTLLELERQVRDTVLRLHEEQADKNDDLNRLSSAIAAAERELGHLDSSLARVGREQEVLRSKAASLWHRFWALLWPPKRRRMEQARVDLDEEQRRLDEARQSRQQELIAKQRQYDQLIGPVQDLQQTTDDLSARRTELTDAARAADVAIDTRILDIMLRSPGDELAARFEQLAPLTSGVEFFRACVDRLTRARVELTSLESRLEQVDQELADAGRRAADGTSQIASAIAAGFHVRSEDRRAAARLRGAVHFQEESSFWGGYSGASGSASGSGSGEASYIVDQVAWNEPHGFPKHADQFKQVWSALGEKSAEREMLVARRAACQTIIDDYVYFLRSELERDFSEHARHGPYR